MENSSISTIPKKFMGFMWLCLFKSLQKTQWKHWTSFEHFVALKLEFFSRRSIAECQNSERIQIEIIQCCENDGWNEGQSVEHYVLWDWNDVHRKCAIIFFSLLIIIVNRTSQVDRYKRKKHIIW